MHGDADLDDPGGGISRPILKDVSLAQYEAFVSGNSFTPVMGRKEKRKARERQKNNDKGYRSRSGTPSSRGLGDSDVGRVDRDNNKRDSQLSAGQEAMAQSSSLNSFSDLMVTDNSQVSQDTPLPPGQQKEDQLPLVIASPPAHLIIDAPTQNSPSQTPISPFTQIGREKYANFDQGPFIVHVQKVEASPNSGVILHPVTFGLFLQKRKREFPNVVDGSVKRIGRNCASLSFHTAEDANSFLSSPTIVQNKYRAFIPTFNVTGMGLVRGVPADWSPEEVLEHLRVPENTGGARPIKIRRLNYKNSKQDGSYNWLPSETVVVTFDGQTLPKRVFLCLSSLAVEIYQYPTIQCFKCCRFGHTKEKCRSLPRCFKCGGAHMGDSCNVDFDTQHPRCCNCPEEVASGHMANSKSCPQYTRQTAIKKTMVEENLSYTEASSLHPKATRKSYANAAAAYPQSPSQSLSYRKTVFRQPRPPPRLSKGYDRRAHEDITRDPVIDSRPVYPEQRLPNDNVINELIKLLSAFVKVLSPSSPLADPSLLSHVAPFISSILSSHNNGPSSHPVELPQYYK